MPFDKFVDIQTITEARRKAIQQSLRSISVDELNKIAKDHEEEFLGDPFVRCCAGILRSSVFCFLLSPCYGSIPPITPNQSMKPTAPFPIAFSVFAIAPCRGLSRSH